MNTADDLIDLFKNATGNTLKADIELLADLDFSSSNVTIPLGASSNDTCVAFSGMFQGNGHSIKGLVMNNRHKEGYKHAGLFCSLKDATVENLVIDQSCSFTGVQSASLGVSVTGSLIVKNVTNHASVSGEKIMAGLIGCVEFIQQGNAVLSFYNSANKGNVNGNGNYVGGIIGSIYRNKDITVTFENITNENKVTGFQFGGLIGNILGNTNINILISNSTNNGSVVGQYGSTGGIIGCVWNNANMEMNFIGCSVFGKISQGSNTGGFVGYIFNNAFLTVKAQSNFNFAQVTGEQYIGGFFWFYS